MFAEYKPDFEDARRHWQAFWAGEIIDRPCIRIVAPKDGAEPVPPVPNLHDPKCDLLSFVKQYDRWAASTYFGGDAVPFFFPNFGPDVYAAFVGADLIGFSPENYTSWAKPFVKNWKTDAARMDQPHGFWWEAAVRFVSQAREYANGRFGVAVFDLHSNLDCLSAARGPQDFCADLMDCPDDVEAALAKLRRGYVPIYDGLYRASGQDVTGSSTWLSCYCEGKYAAIQCDFVCMISPELARRFLYPALEEEAAFLDHCFYHFDGPDALVHLDDILAIKDIDAIQWVPGSGAKPLIEWMDVLKRIQAAGKSVYVSGPPEQVKVYHRELKPEKVFYDISAASQSEADALLDWLKANT